MTPKPADRPILERIEDAQKYIAEVKDTLYDDGYRIVAMQLSVFSDLFTDCKAALSPRPLDDGELEKEYENARGNLIREIESLNEAIDNQSAQRVRQELSDILMKQNSVLQTLTALHARISTLEGEIERLTRAGGNLVEIMSENVKKEHPHDPE